jgi:CelD/BcsL family acetyltransferase involved in cellulose biosynthesis
MADRLSGRIVAPSALEPSLVQLWDRLNGEVPGLASPFLSAHYARALEAAGARVRVCVIYDDGAPCAFFPYQFNGRLAALVKDAGPAGAHMTDYVGLVAPPGLRLSPARLLQLARLNHFGFTHLDASQQDYGLPGEQPRVGLRLRLAGDDPLAQHLRQNPVYLKDSERRERQLARDVGPLRFTFDVRDGRDSVLAHLVENKRSQYQRTGAPDSLAAPWTVRLLRALLESQAPSCRGILSTLYAGDTWLATHFGLAGNGVLQVWLPVYNPDYSRYAPGRLLTHRMIASCPQAGIDVVDRGEGDNPAKRELANEEHFYLRGAWHNRSVTSHVTRSIYSLKWRMKS